MRGGVLRHWRRTQWRRLGCTPVESSGGSQVGVWICLTTHLYLIPHRMPVRVARPRDRRSIGVTTVRRSAHLESLPGSGACRVVRRQARALVHAVACPVSFACGLQPAVEGLPGAASLRRDVAASCTGLERRLRAVPGHGSAPSTWATVGALDQCQLGDRAAITSFMLLPAPPGPRLTHGSWQTGEGGLARARGARSVIEGLAVFICTLAHGTCGLAGSGSGSLRPHQAWWCSARQTARLAIEEGAPSAAVRGARVAGCKPDANAPMCPRRIDFHVHVVEDGAQWRKRVL